MSASASAAPPVIAIYDREDSPTMGDVSDVVDDDTTVVDDDDKSDDEYDDDNDGNDDDDAGETLDDAFFCAARDIMNRASRKVGLAAREDHRFREPRPSRACEWCGICSWRVVCSLRRASRSICFGCSIF